MHSIPALGIWGANWLGNKYCWGSLSPNQHKMCLSTKAEYWSGFLLSTWYQIRYLMAVLLPQERNNSDNLKKRLNLLCFLYTRTLLNHDRKAINYLTFKIIVALLNLLIKVIPTAFVTFIWKWLCSFIEVYSCVWAEDDKRKPWFILYLTPHKMIWQPMGSV